MLATYWLGLHPASVDRLESEELDLMLAGYRWRWNQDVRLTAACLAFFVRHVVGAFVKEAQSVTREQVENTLPRFREADPFAPPDIDPDLVPESE
jgi:hypothetical protein